MAKNKFTFKKIIGKLHLWFGLFIGAIVFIVSVTGALYVFKDEIENILRKEAIYHGEQNIQQKKTLPIATLERMLNQQTHEKYTLSNVHIPLNKNKSYKFIYYEKNPNNVWNYFDEIIIYKSVYVNPYTGKVLAIYDEKNGFFNIVKYIHWSFLLKSDWGTYVVGIPVLIFVFMLISGIILWWPKNKKMAKQRFWFRWKNIKNWRRKNYDLHNILGFYSSIFALIIALTGLVYSFFVIQTAIYYIFSGGETTYPDYSQYKTTSSKELRTEQTLDKIAHQVELIYPNASSYTLDLGHKHLTGGEATYFSVYVKQYDYSYHKSHQIIFDENTGEMKKVLDHKNKNFGEKVVGANYDIHIGAICGIWTKILAFIISLICASLPITGFLVWWGRNNKKEKHQNSKK